MGNEYGFTTTTKHNVQNKWWNELLIVDFQHIMTSDQFNIKRNVFNATFLCPAFNFCQKSWVHKRDISKFPKKRRWDKSSKLYFCRKFEVTKLGIIFDLLIYKSKGHFKKKNNSTFSFQTFVSLNFVSFAKNRT